MKATTSPNWNLPQREIDRLGPIQLAECLGHFMADTERARAEGSLDDFLREHGDIGLALNRRMQKISSEKAWRLMSNHGPQFGRRGRRFKTAS